MCFCSNSLQATATVHEIVYGAGCNNVGQPHHSFLPTLGLVVSRGIAARKTPLLSKTHVCYTGQLRLQYHKTINHRRANEMLLL